jgi:hypothetical protein
MRMCFEKRAYQMTVASADIANGPDTGELIVAERFEYQVGLGGGMTGHSLIKRAPVARVRPGVFETIELPKRKTVHRNGVAPKLHAYLEEQHPTALPKSPLGSAVGYALRNWTALTRYHEDGRLKIDNNGAEQALRPIVLGRKNWLFAGSEAAAHRTAILCSLVQTCKHLQINPFIYLRDVIERVSTHPARLVLELTPREWKRLRQNSRAQAAA